MTTYREIPTPKSKVAGVERGTTGTARPAPKIDNIFEYQEDIMRRGRKAADMKGFHVLPFNTVSDS